jgi:hypothetical protein
MHEAYLGCQERAVPRLSALRVGTVCNLTMFGKPLIADEPEVRRATFVEPRQPRRIGADHRKAEKDPGDFHRQASFLFLFATIGEY